LPERIRPRHCEGHNGTWSGAWIRHTVKMGATRASSIAMSASVSAQLWATGVPQHIIELRRVRVFTSAQELIEYVRKEDVAFIDIRFCDLPGVVQHFNLPAESYGEEEISEGLLFDGSSIRGFQGIHESDM